jgi:hypothetical protein
VPSHGRPNVDPEGIHRSVPQDTGEGDRDALGATPGDKVRAVIIDCDNEELAEQIVEERHDSLP